MAGTYFRTGKTAPGFGMNVAGVKEVVATFGDIARAFSPPELASLMLVGAEIIAEHARNNVLDQELVDTGDLYDSIEAYKINQWSAGVKVSVVYGAVHEFGLERQPITPKQRRFFWAKFKETGESMWKALALSETYTIPARPYLRPAIDENRQETLRAIMREMASVLTKKARLHGGKG